MTMMETLVVAQHRNQYNSRSRAHGPVRLGSFGSPPSRGLSDNNCRTFHSRAGILPTPSKNSTTSITKQTCSYSSSPKTPSPPANTPHSEESKHLKKSAKSGPTTTTTPLSIIVGAKKGARYDKCSFSESWAGPAYSNSPAPSSLPIPKFSIHPKRTVSLDLPSSSASDINFHPIARSAPPSPTREHSHFSSRDLFHSDDSATRTLRRILNLDIAHE